MSEDYEEVVVTEAINDLVEAIEKTIDATETEYAVIATALSILTAKFAGRYMNEEGRKQFGQHMVEAMEALRLED